MRHTKVFKRFGTVNSGRPWKVEITGGPDRDKHELLDFHTEEEARYAALEVRREDIVALGHDEGGCDLVNLVGDPMALCTCGVENPCVLCGEDGGHNNCIEALDPDDTKYPVCSRCFAAETLTESSLERFGGTLTRCIKLAKEA